jgi:hypothetical protein
MSFERKGYEACRHLMDQVRMVRGNLSPANPRRRVDDQGRKARAYQRLINNNRVIPRLDKLLWELVDQ